MDFVIQKNLTAILDQLIRCQGLELDIKKIQDILRDLPYLWFSDNCSKSNQNIKKDSLIFISTYLVFWRSLHDQQSILAFLYSVLWPRWGLATWVITFWREKLWKKSFQSIYFHIFILVFSICIYHINRKIKIEFLYNLQYSKK